MFLRRFPWLVPVVLGSCAMPETALWNDRDVAKSAGMPSEVITKVLVHGTAKSIVSNPISGTHKGLSMWWQRSRLLSDSILKQRVILDEAYSRGGGIEQALDLAGLPEPIPGKVEYLVDGPEFFHALYQSVNGARRQIDTQVYIFDNDDVAADYADLLKRRSDEVRCRVMMDRLGSISSWWVSPGTALPEGFEPLASVPHYLEDGSRVKARMSQNPWLVADHSKLILIDEEEAYLGGMNIGREYRYEWHDLMARVTGPVTTELQNLFNHVWTQQGALGDWETLFHRKKRVNVAAAEASHYPIRILRTGPGRTEIEKAVLIAIRMSRKRIDLQNSYVTSEVILQELLAALKRGVEVNFIFPLVNDSPLLGVANERFGATLLEAGGNVYAYPKFTHVKAVVVDGWACIGSANLDGLSLRINGELNISYSDPAAVQALRTRVFNKDIGRSRRLKKGELQVPLLPFSDPFLQQL